MIKLRLKKDHRFRVGDTSFMLMAGSIVKLTQYDIDREKSLIDFGDNLVDWQHNNKIKNLFHEIDLAFDMNGTEITTGMKVLVHQDHTTEAVVIQPFPRNPTVTRPGCWVDIEKGNEGVEGMPSFILEVVPAPG